MKCAILTIGTELLIGQVIDTNSAYLGQVLGNIGVEVISKTAVADDRDRMLLALSRASEDADIIIMTGGLGPTRDDITKKIIAEHLGEELYFDSDQYSDIQAFFKRLGRETTEAHKQQCFFPISTQFLKNEMGTAPGMLFEKNNTRIIAMPGVPYEMKSIMETQVLPMLASEQELVIVHKTIQTAGVGETNLASLIEDIELGLPDHMSLAYLPSLGKVRVRLTAKGNDKDALESEIELYTKAISERFETRIFGYDDDSLESILGEMLVRKKMKLGLAESCTGGYISSLITSVSGSSAYYEGSIVSYSYDIKEKALNVNHDTLVNCGAVSEEVVKQMVTGAIDALDVDVAIAVSGIAGPGGGTPDKPVGTVWIAVGNKEKVVTKLYTLSKNRSKNIEYSAYAALNMLRLFLIQNN